MAVRHIDLCYDHTDSERSALRLIYTLCPDWEHDEGLVELIPFTEGITNTVCRGKPSTSTRPAPRLTGTVYSS
jgi:ethanolamine kinase